jgi:hypothetical protein
MAKLHGRVLIAAVLLAAAALARPAAQAPTRIATTADALVASPVFFQGKQIAIRQPLEVEGELVRLAGTARPVFVYWRQRPARQDGEIRGEFWDIGRFEEFDPRFAGYDFRPMLDAASKGQWPPRERLYVIVGASVVESQLPQAPSLRALALAPADYEGREVTLAGRFKGANLYGDLPQGVGKSKWDFVLQSADAAVWISGLRPRGRGFELDPTRRLDTGRWLRVTGTVRRDGPQVWIEGRTLEPAEPEEEAAVETPAPVIARNPPPSVIFSAPVVDDFDVNRNLPVRLQFSNDMRGGSFEGAVRVTYTGENPPPPPKFTIAYNGGTRSLEIQFAEPLERFQAVKVELLEGIAAVDGQPLAPWSLTFTTGG